MGSFAMLRALITDPTGSAFSDRIGPSHAKKRISGFLLSIAVCACAVGCSDSGETQNTSADEQSTVVPAPNAESPPSRTSSETDPLSLTSAVEEDEISQALAPLWSDASQLDVLGVRLGMGFHQVEQTLEEQGYTGGNLVSDTRKDRTIDGISGNFLDQAVFRKEATSGAPRETITTSYTTSSKPQLFALHRELTYSGGDEVPYERIVAALEERYGPPSSREYLPRGRSEWLMWPSQSADGCEQSIGNISFSGWPRSFGGGSECTRALVAIVYYRENRAGKPVGRVNIYLVDSVVKEEDMRLVSEIASRNETRRRQLQLDSAEAPAF